MSNFVISCCSTVDLDYDLLVKRDIKYIPFHYFVNDKEYIEDFGKTYPLEKFYNDMENDATTRTSQVAVGDYEEYFRNFAKEGKDIIHICLSSGISGTSQSAKIAADMVKEDYPDRKIVVIDSLAASSGFGLLATAMADLRDEGKSFDEIVSWVEENKLNLHHWFFSTDLKYYVRGGRVSRVSGFIGNLLHICPLLNVSNEGRLIPREKVRTVKKVEARLVEKMEEFYDKLAKFKDTVYICHSNCIEYANAVKEMIEEKFDNLKNKVKIFSIGTTIGAHTGPGTVALFFWGSKRVD